MSTAHTLLHLNTFRARTIDTVLRVTRMFESRRHDGDAERQRFTAETYTAVAAKLVALLSILPLSTHSSQDMQRRLIDVAAIAESYVEFPLLVDAAQDAPRQIHRVTQTVRQVIMRISRFAHHTKVAGDTIARYILRYARRRMFSGYWVCPRLEEALRALARAFVVAGLF